MLCTQNHPQHIYIYMRSKPALVGLRCVLGWFTLRGAASMICLSISSALSLCWSTKYVRAKPTADAPSRGSSSNALLYLHPANHQPYNAADSQAKPTSRQRFDSDYEREYDSSTSEECRSPHGCCGCLLITTVPTATVPQCGVVVLFFLTVRCLCLCGSLAHDITASSKPPLCA
jgi:hypothetical protein